VPAVSGGTVKLKSGEKGAAKEPAGEDGPHPGDGRTVPERIRENIGFLQKSLNPDFHITPEIRTRFPAISGRRIDRVLQLSKAAFRLNGISGAKPAEQRLLQKVPVRTQYRRKNGQNLAFDRPPAVSRQVVSFI